MATIQTRFHNNMHVSHLFVMFNYNNIRITIKLVSFMISFKYDIFTTSFKCFCVNFIQQMAPVYVKLIFKFCVMLFAFSSVVLIFPISQMAILNKDVEIFSVFFSLHIIHFVNWPLIFTETAFRP